MSHEVYELHDEITELVARQERFREVVTAELRRWNFDHIGIERFWIAVDSALGPEADKRVNHAGDG